MLGTPQRVFHDIDELVEVVQANINERMNAPEPDKGDQETRDLLRDLLRDLSWDDWGMFTRHFIKLGRCHGYKSYI